MGDSPATSCCIIHPVIRAQEAERRRSPSACLAEAVSLAEGIGLEIAYASAVPVAQIKPSTLIGAGKIQEILQLVQGGVDLVIIDHALSPLQQRNLERALECKVIDRTALILEIFGERARTKEGVLQVELAALDYQKSRLVRSWTHLERQRGGAGFMGGPGETQIELDRRIISNKISTARKKLDQVRRSRGLHREQRRSVPFPTVALVGYTNAGKSSLFNTLTKAKVYAQDQLFATLDPTVRQLHLGDGLNVLLSDTVGFISDLPTQLIAAFRATLEEVLEADILLHVRDMAHPDAEAQKADVLDVLASLFGNRDFENHMIEVWNKADLPEYDEIMREEMCVSAVTGEGLDELREELARLVTQQHYLIQKLRIPHSDAGARSWLYAHAHVESCEDDQQGCTLVVRLTEAQLGRITQQWRNISLLPNS